MSEEKRGVGRPRVPGHRITMKLTPEQYEYVLQKAEKDGVPPSTAFTELVRAWWATNPPPKLTKPAAKKARFKR